MSRSECLFADRQSPLEERLRFGVFPLVVVQNRQVVQTCGHVRVLRTETFLADRQRALMQTFCFFVPPHDEIEVCQGVQAYSHICICWIRWGRRWYYRYQYCWQSCP